MTRKAPNASCQAVTAAGQPCPAPAMKGITVCMMHSDDPAVAMRAQIARSVGLKLSQLRGRHFKPAIELETPADWLLAIAAITNDLASMPNTPARISSFALLSREAREWIAVREALEGRDVIDA